MSGRVTSLGELPIAERVSVERDRSFCGETIPDEALQADQESHGVVGVVISLGGVSKGKRFP